MNESQNETHQSAGMLKTAQCLVRFQTLIRNGGEVIAAEHSIDGVMHDHQDEQVDEVRSARGTGSFRVVGGGYFLVA